MNILNKLTLKHLKMNKRRTIVTIIGVMLSCALMVGVGLMLSSLQRNLVVSTEQNSGTHHATIDNIDSKNLNIVKQNVNVDKIDYEQRLDYVLFEKILDKGTGENLNAEITNANDEFFATLEIREGRRPRNNKEIMLPYDLKWTMKEEYQIGSTVTLDIAQILETEVENEDGSHDIQGEFVKTGEKEYRIVGFYSHITYNQMSTMFYTKDDVMKHDNIRAYITYRNINKVTEKTESIAKKLDKKVQKTDDGSLLYDDVNYNWSLLAVYGQSKYDNYNSMMYQMLGIVLVLISVACIIVIYNSFNISVMERKKQFGLFSSIGATKRQLRYTVFYEAILIAAIGLPLGVISGYIGIEAVLMIINRLLPDLMEPALTFYSYPIFTIIPVIFMTAVIFISAYLPAKRASKVTPIEAIRQNDDIKIKGKKIKTNRFIKKIFGIEGDIAYKNMKRNKKKYRITVVSLFISIVLFVSFAGFLKYGLYGTESILQASEYDGYVNIGDKDIKKITTASKEILRTKGINKYTIVTQDNYYTDLLLEKDYNEQYYNLPSKTMVINQDEINKTEVRLYMIDNKSYQEFIDKLGISEDKQIVLNNTNKVYYEKGNRKNYIGNKIKEKDSFNLYSNPSDDAKGVYTLDNLYYTDELPFGFQEINQIGDINILVSEDTFHKILNSTYATEEEKSNYYNFKQIYMKLDKDNDVDKVADKMIEASKLQNMTYFNVEEMQKMQRNLVLVIKILLYGFIGLVTLIGITSVFNTISTSLMLRKKEFAMLRSMGLTPKGFKKILWFESFFFVFKALLYSLPVSFGIIYLIHVTLGQNISLPHMLIPWVQIIIAIVFSFIIVLMTTIYSTRKMRKENILEAIREENI